MYRASNTQRIGYSFLINTAYHLSLSRLFFIGCYPIVYTQLLPQEVCRLSQPNIQVHADWDATGYFTDLFPNENISDSSLPSDVTLAIGVSVWSIFILALAAFLLPCIPIFLSLLKLPADMTVVGSNSLAISAACHVSPLSHAASKEPFMDTRSSKVGSKGIVTGHRYNTGQTHIPGYLNHPSSLTSPEEPLMSKEIHNYESGVEDSIFSNLARSKLRWGEVQMPQSWYRFNSRTPVQHLSFGVQEDTVLPPAPGRWYS